MTLRSLLLAALIGGTALGAAHAPPAAAGGHVAIGIGFGPPPPRYERVVVRPGFAWTPGYWRWSGRRHVWVGGYSLRARPGYRYVGPRWYPYRPAYHPPRWRFRAGYWIRL